MLRLSRIFILVSLLILMLSQALQGTTYQLISDIGTSAKTVGIGRVEGFDSSASSIFENPASLAGIESISLSGFATQVMDEVTYFNVCAAYRTDIGTLAAGVMQASVSDIPMSVKDSFTGVVSYAGSSFGYRNTIAKAAYEFPAFEKIHLGLAATYYFNQIYTTSGSGYSTDFGALWDLENLQISGALKNFLVLKNVAYDNGVSEELPLQAVLSAKYVWGDVDLYGQAKMPDAQGPILPSFGLKYQPSSNGRILFFSAGYGYFLALNQVKSNFAIGLGLELPLVQVYFAYDKSEYWQEDNRYFISTAITI